MPSSFELPSGTVRRVLVGIVLLSVFLRVVVALVMGNRVEALPGIYDQISYDALAQRVVAGYGFSFASLWWPLTRAGAPTAFWSFLYTGWLAAVYALLGHQPLIARLLQVLCVGAALPVGLYELGRRVLGARVGVWAAALSAVYGYFVYYSAALMTEMPTIVAVVAMLILFVALAEGPTRRRYLLLGLAIAVAALLRQVVLLTVPVLAAWLLWRRRGWATVRGLALAGAVVCACVLPVTLRNHHVFHRWVFLNTNAGYAFFWANHPIQGVDFQGILSDEGPGYRDLIPVELRGLDEAAMERALMGRGIGFVVAEPMRYLRLSFSRLEDYFRFWPLASSSLISNLTRTLSFGLLLPFMLYGLWCARDRWRACLPLVLFMATYALAHLFSWALIRYRLPVDAILLIFAGLAFDRLVGARLARMWPAGWGGGETVVVTPKGGTLG